MQLAACSAWELHPCCASAPTRLRRGWRELWCTQAQPGAGSCWWVAAPLGSSNHTSSPLRWWQYLWSLSCLQWGRQCSQRLFIIELLPQAQSMATIHTIPWKMVTAVFNKSLAWFFHLTPTQRISCPVLRWQGWLIKIMNKNDALEIHLFLFSGYSKILLSTQLDTNNKGWVLLYSAPASTVTLFSKTNEISATNEIWCKPSMGENKNMCLPELTESLSVWNKWWMPPALFSSCCRWRLSLIKTSLLTPTPPTAPSPPLSESCWPKVLKVLWKRGSLGGTGSSLWAAGESCPFSTRVDPESVVLPLPGRESPRLQAPVIHGITTGTSPELSSDMSLLLECRWWCCWWWCGCCCCCCSVSLKGRADSERDRRICSRSDLVGMGESFRSLEGVLASAGFTSEVLRLFLILKPPSRWILRLVLGWPIWWSLEADTMRLSLFGRWTLPDSTMNLMTRKLHILVTDSYLYSKQRCT